MAHCSRRRLYETAFDSKVEKRSEESSGDLLDRIANHPILQLLNPRRRSSRNHPPPPASNNNNNHHHHHHHHHPVLSATKSHDGTLQPPSQHNLNSSRHLHNDKSLLGRCRAPIVLPKSKFHGGGTPRCGRRGARARISAPTRSLSSHHLIGSSMRPIGLSKSDDQILNRVSDSPDDEDCLEDYVEGQQAEDLARDLITLHVSHDGSRKNSYASNLCISHIDEVTTVQPHHSSSSKNQNEKGHHKLSARERFRRCHRIGVISGRGVSVDGRIDGAHSGYCSTESSGSNINERSRGGRASSILALHHPNVNSPRLLHSQHLQSCSTNSNPHVYSSNDSSPRVLHREMSSPRFSHSAASSPRVYHSNISPRLLHGKSASPRLPHSALSSPKLQHVTDYNTHSYNMARGCSPKLTVLSTSAAIARVLQSSYDSSSAPSVHSNSSINEASLAYADEPSTSGCSSNIPISKKHSLRDVERSEGLAKLKPLELHTPPGTAPLPVKFIKKTPLSDRSPSSWFSPPRQKDLSLPVKRSSQSRSSSSDASTSERSTSKVRCKTKSGSSNCETANSALHDMCLTADGSQNSLNSSMEVLVDTVSQSGLSLPTQVNVKTSSFSLDSMVSGGSSLESLKSSMSEGCKSVAEGSVSGSGGWRNMGSNTSLPLRPSLLLPASHRSLKQTAKFQILSPISDKSQEPSSTDTGGPIVVGCGLVGGGSQLASPQEILQQTPVQPRNIPDDFRNVHHILPGPPSTSSTKNKTSRKKLQPESDSGISIEYAATQNRSSASHTSHSVLKDLPFDMPKLRRRLAAARSCPSTSNSSLTSSGERSHNVSSHAALNPAISRVQASDCHSGTSSSNSSDWDVRSSAASSVEGTPKKCALGRIGLALDLGCSSMAAIGEKIDVSVPLTKQNWYHGSINRGDAENLLRSEGEGTYLVRSIDTPRKEYSLALKASCGFMHLKIQYNGDGKGYKIGKGDQVFESVPHVIYHHSIHRLPIKGAEHMFLLKSIISETL